MSLTIELLMLLLLRLEMFQMLLITMIMRMGMITIFIGALLTVTILEKYFKYSYHGHLSLNKGHKCQTEYIFPSLAPTKVHLTVPEGKLLALFQYTEDSKQQRKCTV